MDINAMPKLETLTFVSSVNKVLKFRFFLLLPVLRLWHQEAFSSRNTAYEMFIVSSQSVGTRIYGLHIFSPPNFKTTRQRLIKANIKLFSRYYDDVPSGGISITNYWIWGSSKWVTINPLRRSKYRSGCHDSRYQFIVFSIYQGKIMNYSDTFQFKFQILNNLKVTL